MTLGLQAVLHQLQHGKEHVNLACTAGAGWTIQRTVPIERATTSSYAVAAARSCQVYVDVFKHALPGVCIQTCAGAAAYPSADASVCTEKVQRSTTSCVAALVTTITNRCSVPDANHSAAVQTRQRATTGQQGVCLQLGERVDLKCSSRNKGGGRKEGSRPDSKHLKTALKPRAYAFLHQLYQARACTAAGVAWAESRLQRLSVLMIFHTDPCAAHLASAP